MKTPYVVLIVGAVLFSVGLISSSISTITLEQMSDVGAVLLENELLEPRTSFTGNLKVTEGNVTILIRTNPPNVVLNTKIQNSVGEILFEQNSTNTLFTPIELETEKEYLVKVTNLGSESVNVEGFVGRLPFSSIDEIQDVTSIAITILIGSFVFVIGIIILLVGGILVIKKTKTKKRKS